MAQETQVETLPGGLTKIPVSIANGASLSGLIKLAGLAICGVVMPAAWTAANLTFQGAIDDDGGDLKDIYDAAGIEMTVVAAASRHIILDPIDFSSVRFIKVRSGTTGTPVNQGALREFFLLARAL